MQVLHEVEPIFWWEVARKCPYATFFHTPLWNEIARWYYPHYRDCSMGFIMPNGTRAVLPLLMTDCIGPLHKLISSFEGCYGGIIADGPLSRDDIEQIYSYTYQWQVIDFYYLANPLTENREIDEELKFDDEVAYLVHLDADFDTIFSRFLKSARTSYRRGVREGFEVRRAESLEDYRAYYAAYRDAVDRWGYDDSYGYGWPLFEHFAKLEQQHPEQITLWVITNDDVVVGGTLAFYWNQHATAWHGTVTREALKRRAMVVLDTEIIRDAATRGYQYYDLNTSAKIEGVVTYKQNFGSVPYPLARCRYQSQVLTPALNVYRKIRYGSLGASVSLMSMLAYQDAYLPLNPSFLV